MTKSNNESTQCYLIDPQFNTVIATCKGDFKSGWERAFGCRTVDGTPVNPFDVKVSRAKKWYNKGLECQDFAKWDEKSMMFEVY